MESPFRCSRLLVVLPFLVAVTIWTAHHTFQVDAVEYHPETPVSLSSLISDIPRCPAPTSLPVPIKYTIRAEKELRFVLPDEPEQILLISRGPPVA